MMKKLGLEATVSLAILGCLREKNGFVYTITKGYEQMKGEKLHSSL
jgi:hypothetical protein